MAKNNQTKTQLSVSQTVVTESTCTSTSSVEHRHSQRHPLTAAHQRNGDHHDGGEVPIDRDSDRER